jgi:hypothetical protein
MLLSGRLSVVGMVHFILHLFIIIKNIVHPQMTTRHQFRNGNEEDKVLKVAKVHSPRGQQAFEWKSQNSHPFQK